MRRCKFPHRHGARRRLATGRCVTAATPGRPSPTRRIIQRPSGLVNRCTHLPLRCYATQPIPKRRNHHPLRPFVRPPKLIASNSSSCRNSSPGRSLNDARGHQRKLRRPPPRTKHLRLARGPRARCKPSAMMPPWLPSRCLCSPHPPPPFHRHSQSRAGARLHLSLPQCVARQFDRNVIFSRNSAASFAAIVNRVRTLLVVSDDDTAWASPVPRESPIPSELNRVSARWRGITLDRVSAWMRRKAANSCGEFENARSMPAVSFLPAGIPLNNRQRGRRIDSHRAIRPGRGP